MMVMTDAGFAPDDFGAVVRPLAEIDLLRPGDGIEIGPADDPGALAAVLGRVGLVRVRFGAFNDGRGFTRARDLRALGYGGRLRALGPIADQYAMARRSGFDEVEVDAALAARQPEAQWLSRAGWRDYDYRARLRA